MICEKILLQILRNLKGIPMYNGLTKKKKKAQCFTKTDLPTLENFVLPETLGNVQ